LTIEDWEFHKFMVNVVSTQWFYQDGIQIYSKYIYFKVFSVLFMIRKQQNLQREVYIKSCKMVQFADAERSTRYSHFKWILCMSFCDLLSYKPSMHCLATRHGFAFVSLEDITLCCLATRRGFALSKLDRLDSLLSMYVGFIMRVGCYFVCSVSSVSGLWTMTFELLCCHVAIRESENSL